MEKIKFSHKDHSIEVDMPIAKAGYVWFMVDKIDAGRIFFEVIKNKLELYWSQTGIHDKEEVQKIDPRLQPIEDRIVKEWENK